MAKVQRVLLFMHGIICAEITRQSRSLPVWEAPAPSAGVGGDRLGVDRRRSLSCAVSNGLTPLPD